MRKHLFRIILIFIAYEAFREVGENITFLVRHQPAFKGWHSLNGILLNLSTYSTFLLYALITYILFQKLYHRNKKATLGYWFIASSAIITMRYWIEEGIYPAFLHFRNYYPDTPFGYYYSDNAFFAITYSAFGAVYFFIQNEREQRLRQANLQLLNQQTELSFLRSQINPHFLFNSLNSIYSLVYHHSDQSLTAIAKLSDLLRYMLYDTNEKVPLQKELDYIHRYIELQQLRFEKATPIQLSATGTIEKISIPPLLLIPFVENAFKHGDMKHPQPIQIGIHADDHTLRFFMTNPIGHHQKDAGGGIGLDNVQRRLNLMYPDRHILQVQKTKDIFEVQLEINQ